MLLIPSKNQPKGWKNLLFWILLVSSGGNWCCIGLHDAWATNLKTGVSQDKPVSKIITRPLAEKIQHSSESPIPSNPAPSTIATADPNQASTEELETIQQRQDSAQREVQPSDNSQGAPEGMEKILNPPQMNQPEGLERFRLLLQEPRQPPPESDKNNELGLRVRPRPLKQLPPPSKPPPESDKNNELGLRVRPRPLEQLPLPPTEKPVVQFKPIGYLRANVGYFQTSNIFSANDRPIEDGLIFSGLTLASAYFPLGPKTYINGSINGNLIRYVDQSKYDYNQLRFNLGLYQQLSQRMYGEISWSNQQLFFADQGDRFLNENALRLSLGRRDPLTQRLVLDTLYELSVNFADPQSRSRVINSFWVSLSYYLQKPLNIGLDYQLNLSDFTQRDREDQFHRLFGHLNYRISNSSNLNLQSGVTLGGSTTPNIDFNGWFFSVNYNVELGRF
jgi:hypothetical protein